MVYPGPKTSATGSTACRFWSGREEGVVYAFCGKSGRSLKFLEFEKDAVWLTQVKIRHGRFPFPKAGDARVIATEELSAIVVSALAVAKVESLRNGLITERYLEWLFENSGRLLVGRLSPGPRTSRFVQSPWETTLSCRI